ncbi:hypothetical protein ABB37_04692 [Leptomonas pyrrhocoris]|uniref:Uncharacterized protein n=1 Tax=Leptomonas pyrrhocoris TaxID=157538 RepID=A0A0M9G1H2_LEPPY|nr:hypothetical protein ABB37_04692 [Leptomonas pyrrhocoris]KPA80470.1 hypothetical protein ABB37_04692 [Leptomonas pyrrhocoris]|eukprot:XP_015658909.1 hypothetical protein ABB37_04692 [Leptomonas pyrrhocoris]
MDFNPISIEEEDGHTQRPNGVAVPPIQGSRGSSGILNANSTFGDALRMCHNAFYYHTSWSVPYPEVPASPMLYYPDEYRRLVDSPAPLGVMQSELDAMQMGVLDSIPLAYYPLNPTAIEEARLAMQRNLLKKKRTEAAATTTAATEASPTTNVAAAAAARHGLRGRLAPGDAEIARIIVDPNEIQIRNLPSLTHVQRPLYTDIGLVPQEDRHAARVARTQPKESKPVTAAVTTADMLRQWRLDVQASFQEAGQVDAGFARFIAEVAHTKLGLDRTNPRHLHLTRALWSRLFQGTRREQQHKVWYALCRFSSTFDDTRAPEAAVAQMRLDRESLKLPQYAASWFPLLKEYAEAVRDYAASLAGGVEQRRENLQFHDKELDELYSGNVYTNIELDGKLVRTSADRQKSAIYPVEVLPVYPSGYQRAAEMGPTVLRLQDAEALDFLAERDASLHHVILPDAVLPKSALRRPHMLVGDCNLLVAEEGDFSSVQPGSTLCYGVSEENAYQSLQKEPLNTASYLLRLEQTVAEAAQPLGTNYDGRYVAYDRIGHRDIYQKTNSADSSTLSRYVVMFADAPVQGGTAPAAAAAADIVDAGVSPAGAKREREGVGATATAATDDDAGPAFQVPRMEF